MERRAALGLLAAWRTPAAPRAALGEFIRTENSKWGAVIRVANIQGE